MNEAIFSLIQDYFSSSLTKHGPTAQGVDWKNEQAQFLRFEQLLKILPAYDFSGSLLDFGCGYGALLAFMRERGCSLKYVGYDCVEAMIEQAMIMFAADENASFLSGEKVTQSADYVVASGVFNQKGDIKESDWTNYVYSSLDHLNTLANKGLAVNFLTFYSDQDKMRSDLYYANPLAIFDHCKKNYSKNVALLHDYGAYEFTLLIRK